MSDVWYAAQKATLRRIAGSLKHWQKRYDADLIHRAEWRLGRTSKGWWWTTWQGLFDDDSILIRRLIDEILRLKSRERFRFTRAMELKHSAINAQLILYDILREGECSEATRARIEAVLKESMA
jgi:hypothetical protein